MAPPTPGRRSDVLSDLMTDHWRVELLLDKIDDAAADERGPLIDQLRTQLSMHLITEEQVLYSAVARGLADGIHIVAAATGEHRRIEHLLESVGPHRKGMKALAALAEIFDAHVRDEEGGLFVRLRHTVDREQLEALSDALHRARAASGVVDVRDEEMVDLIGIRERE